LELDRYLFFNKPSRALFLRGSFQPSRTDDQLSAEIAALESLSTAQLRERWKAFYGTEPQPRASSDLLMRAVAIASRNARSVA
jgi:hypothetical protein